MQKLDSLEEWVDWWKISLTPTFDGHPGWKWESLSIFVQFGPKTYDVFGEIDRSLLTKLSNHPIDGSADARDRTMERANIDSDSDHEKLLRLQGIKPIVGPEA
jgi:hypothetical protein